jgi:type IV pilus assembly protein PilE
MIAYPSFVQSLRNSNRSDAQAAIARVSVNLERFFATNGTYTINSAQLGLQMDGGDAVSDANHYVISVAAGATGIASSYVITATAAGDSTQAHDAGCTVLSLDSLGQRIPDPNGSRCW